MIPLLRPTLPPAAVAERYLRTSRKARQLANFGPCHQRLVASLEELMDGRVVLTTSGTAAITLALRSIGVERKTEILVPDFTHVGTLIAAHRVGSPVLCGVSPETWRIRPEDVNKEKPGAIIVVEPFGYGTNWDEWRAISSTTKVVFDCAGGWRPNVRDAPAPVCFSFHATKNLSVGEGGMIWYPKSMGDAADLARRLSNFDTLPGRDVASLDGDNLKLDELRCAYLLAATETEWLAKVEARALAKRAMVKIYESRLALPVKAPILDNAAPSLCVLGGLPAARLEASSDGAVFRRYYPLLSRMAATEKCRHYSVSPPELTSCCALPSDVDLNDALKVVDIVRKHL